MKIRRFFFAVASCVFFSATTFADTAFGDVSVVHPNYAAIQYAKNQDMISGYPDNTFRPDSTINRAELTKILTEATLDADKISHCHTVDFSDVPNDQWFASYVCAAKSWNLIDGYPDNTFRPDHPINFAEAAKIISNAFHYTTVDHQQTTAVPWYEPFVIPLESHHAIPATVSSFSHDLTRGELAEIIYRIKTGTTSKFSSTYAQLAGTAKRISYLDLPEAPDYDDVLVVFVYLDDPLPEDVMQKITGTRDNPDSLMYFETWASREAQKYGRDFKRSLVFYPEQIKVPEVFIKSELLDNGYLSRRFKDDSVFESWLLENHHDMQNYDTIGILTLKFSRSYARGDGFFYHGLSDWLKFDFSDQNVFAFAHEFFHTLGARDKYQLTEADKDANRVCELDEFGNQYDNHDLFCRTSAKTFNELGKLPPPEFDETYITPPTAVEIGWKDGNHITKECLTGFPEIQKLQIVKETEEVYAFRLVLNGCINQFSNKYDITVAKPNESLSSRGDGFTFTRVPPVNYIYKEDADLYYVSICDIEVKEMRPQYLRRELCGNIIEINPTNSAWREVDKEPR